MLEHRLNQQTLIDTLAQWNAFLKRKVHLIACGGTAMTLLGVKASTQDIDFMVPAQNEYDYLIKIIKQLGYENKRGWSWVKKGELVVFDLFPGKRIHTTELLDSPLEKGGHTLLKEFSNIYLGVLNDYDLIISKLFRGDAVDFADCVHLAQVHKGEIDLNKLKKHFFKMLSYHPVGEGRIEGHWQSFERKLQEAE